MSTAKFTAEEQALINLINKDSTDYVRIAQLLENAIGNLSFNRKLRNIAEPSYTESVLTNFTYKTAKLDKSQTIFTKYKIIEKQNAAQIKLTDDEKLSLGEIRNIQKLASLKDNDSLVNLVQNCAGHSDKLRDLSSSMEQAASLQKEINTKTLENLNYQSGDLMMHLISKDNAFNNKTGFGDNFLTHGGKAEEILVTKYSHAAMVHVADGKSYESHIIDNKYLNDITIREILISDTFRLDPTKLINKKYIAALETIDFGYKQDQNGDKILDDNGNSTKNTWQDVIKSDYQKLSYDLQKNISDTDTYIRKGEQYKKSSADKEKEVYKLFDDMSIFLNSSNNNSISKLRKQASLGEFTALDYTKFLKGNIHLIDNTNLQQTMADKADRFIAAYNELEVIKTDVKINIATHTLQSDEKRFAPSNLLNWFKPHNNIFSRHDMRDLSQKMFNAKPDEKRMICSEFAARSIAAVMDQLNEKTAKHLIDAGIINKEETIVQNPISRTEKFANLHPERLVDILAKAGCIEPLQNKFLQTFVRLEDTSKAQTEKLEYSSTLPKKIYSVLRTAKTLKDFSDETKKVMNIYLEALNVPKAIRENAEAKEIDHRLNAIYDNYRKEPKGIIKKIESTCIKILEFCKIRTEDLSTKRGLDDMVKNIKTAADTRIMKQAEPAIKVLQSNMTARSETSKSNQLSTTPKSNISKAKLRER